MKKKSVLSVILALISLVCTIPFASGLSVLLGDVNASGKVDAEDARAILRFAVSLDAPGERQAIAADMDLDGKITAQDARLALRTSVGLETLTYYSEDDPSVKRDSPEAAAFKSILYDVAHEFYDRDGYGASFWDKRFYRETPLMEVIYGTAGKWCCYYTVHDVFRPALREAGYSEARIEQLAPLYYPQKTIATALSNIVASETNDYKDVAKKLNVPSYLVPRTVPFYIPSVLMDYYQNATEDICTVYTLHEYYDDVVADKLIGRSANAFEYKPQVGDVIFMSNKSRTYSHGYPTVDHTAQIIEVDSDGTFLCTEGSIIIDGEPDSKPRVRERWYKYSSKYGTYVYENNDIVRVLACVRPKL